MALERILLLGIAIPALFGQAPQTGRAIFEKTCAKCHGGDGRGGEMGPNILSLLNTHDRNELQTIFRNGTGGMPPVHVSTQDMPLLVRYLRSIQRPREVESRSLKAELTDGTVLDGVVTGEGFDDVQLRTGKRIHLLRRVGDRFREVTSEQNWPGYDGDPGGNRYTAATQIDKSNVAHLGAKWVFSVPNAGGLEATPVVVDGVMYVTAYNECYALDAGTGREIWRFRHRSTRGFSESLAGKVNRGAAVAGDRVFMDTDEAHLVALDRFTGEKLWETVIADWRKNYFTTSAPQIAGDLVLSGVGGGEAGTRGFVAAFDQNTGKEVWRFWTVPKPGEPGSETWKGSDIEHGGAPTWFIGTYDPELDVVYWPTGNPAQEYNGAKRGGDDLYSDSLLALDRKTGKLKWYFQFTPHDLWDWDSTETSVLIDADWQGSPRKLILHADRNGFFYVFDRTDGKLLLAKPFLRNINWASGIDAKGRPMLNPGIEPSEKGTHVCPSQDGATNWFSPSYNPGTGLYYFQTFEKCADYRKREGDVWEPGQNYLGGSQRTSRDPKPVRVLKALNIQTGEVVWELPQPGPAQTWGGTLSTATGLVFVAEEGGSFMAVDATNGKPLWKFQANANWKASPMTYMFDGKEHIAIAAGSNIISFSLPD